jgi:DNA-binding beta-propeller fold protein YncE
MFDCNSKHSSTGQLPKLTRRDWVRTVTGGLAAAAIASNGCVPQADLATIQPDTVWGRRGLSEGRLLKPRAIAIDRNDELYLVDTTGRIQVFDTDGEYLRGWKTPETENGRPTGLAIDDDNHLLVADTHYFRMLVFDIDGTPLPRLTIGGTSGSGPGEFAFVTDAVRNAEGVCFVGEYGDSDRIQRFDLEGKFIDAWGGTGQQPGLFVRPQSLILSPDQTQLWVADACNHRIQAFDVTGKPELIACWGSEGPSPGQLYYPYDLAFASDGSLFVCEYGNQRVQHFSIDGQSLGTLGGPGHSKGEFYQPWGIDFDSRGRLFVLDSNNHRVQRYLLS